MLWGKPQYGYFKKSFKEDKCFKSNAMQTKSYFQIYLETEVFPCECGKQSFLRGLPEAWILLRLPKPQTPRKRLQKYAEKERVNKTDETFFKTVFHLFL